MINFLTSYSQNYFHPDKQKTIPEIARQSLRSTDNKLFYEKYFEDNLFHGVSLLIHSSFQLSRNRQHMKECFPTAQSLKLNFSPNLARENH